jgi:hypothetical protein
MKKMENTSAQTNQPDDKDTPIETTIRKTGQKETSESQGNKPEPDATRPGAEAEAPGEESVVAGAPNQGTEAR